MRRLHALVKYDLDRISWWGLDDPFAIESLLIELRPARRQNDAIRSFQVSTTWCLRTREGEKHRTCLKSSFHMKEVFLREFSVTFSVTPRIHGPCP